MKYITTPTLISVNQEINANIVPDSGAICKVECFQVENEDVADYHTPASLQEGPFHSMSNSLTSGSFGQNPVYNLVAYASSAEYPALKATISTSFPDFDFSSLCPWNFKIIKTFDQAKSNITWNFSSVFQNAEIVINDIFRAIEDTVNLSEVQIYQYEPDGSDAFSDMGYTTTYSYFFVDEPKNKVLFLHMRQGDVEDEMSDVDDGDVLETRFGFGVF